jgi:hypothetical protein
VPLITGYGRIVHIQSGWGTLFFMPREKPWGDMPEIERRLYYAAQDGTELGHILLKEREHLPGGTIKEYPPKDPEVCSEILLQWFDGGLIHVYQVLLEEPWYKDVPESEARRLLADPPQWGFDRGVSLSAAVRDGTPWSLA